MSYRVRWNTPITLFPNRCCLQLGAVFSLVRASARWKRCNLTAYRLYNWCRSWHECAPSCRHAEILRLNRKISIDVRKSNSVSELLWSQLSSVSTNWTSEPLLCPSPAASFPTSDFQSLRITFPKRERGTLSEGESLWKKCWFTRYQGNGSHKRTTENNEGYFVGGFIIYQIFFNVISSASGMQQ